MAKQVKIKEIAALAGVSAGTVDRILHGRGNVSAAKRAAVEEVLARVGYKFNLHTSAVSLKHGYRIIITTPQADEGEYWGSIIGGIQKALEEYSDIRIEPDWCPYDQFDAASCQEVFAAVPEQSPDGVIIGPTFEQETLRLCRELDRRNIPYVFVDADIPDANPVAVFAADQEACGRLLGHLVLPILREKGKLAVFGIKRKGPGQASSSASRGKGLDAFLQDNGLQDRTLSGSITLPAGPESEKEAAAFFKSHPEVRAVAVLNSRGHLIADILRRQGIDHIPVISFDLTRGNIRCLGDGSISVLLCQRPELQGFSALKSLISYLLYRNRDVRHVLPIDILVKENLPYYREVIEF
ncbi:MAG: LacI family DNA-binding transcriptional regulator [Bacteroidales bacterium]|nr:LacI family DNA-binding transcriptional regulator [Bacteroidales bacterium]